jgi:hypothetical protein
MSDNKVRKIQKRFNTTAKTLKPRRWERLQRAEIQSHIKNAVPVIIFLQEIRDFAIDNDLRPVDVQKYNLWHAGAQDRTVIHLGSNSSEEEEKDPKEELRKRWKNARDEMDALLGGFDSRA